MRILLLLLLVSISIAYTKHIPHESSGSRLLRSRRSDSDEAAKSIDSNISNNDDDDDDDSSGDDSIEKKRIEEQKRKQEIEEEFHQKLLERIESERRKAEEQEKKIKERLEKRERQLREKLEKEKRKQLERNEKEERKRKEKLEKEQTDAEKEKCKLEDSRKKSESKLNKDESKRQAQIQKQLDDIKNDLLKQSDEDDFLETEEESSVELEDIWRNHIYVKYGLTFSSTKLEKQAALNKYLEEELGLSSNSTKSERRNAIVKLIEAKLNGDPASRESLKKEILGQTNIVAIQNLCTKLENEISELNNKTELLNNKTILFNNVTLPWMQQAKQNITNTKTFLQTVVRFLTDVVANETANDQPSKNNSINDISVGTIRSDSNSPLTTERSPKGLAVTQTVTSTDVNENNENIPMASSIQPNIKAISEKDGSVVTQSSVSAKQPENQSGLPLINSNVISSNNENVVTSLPSQENNNGADVSNVNHIDQSPNSVDLSNDQNSIIQVTGDAIALNNRNNANATLPQENNNKENGNGVEEKFSNNIDISNSQTSISNGIGDVISTNNSNIIGASPTQDINSDTGATDVNNVNQSPNSVDMLPGKSNINSDTGATDVNNVNQSPNSVDMLPGESSVPSVAGDAISVNNENSATSSVPGNNNVGGTVASDVNQFSDGFNVHEIQSNLPSVTNNDVPANDGNTATVNQESSNNVNLPESQNSNPSLPIDVISANNENNIITVPLTKINKSADGTSGVSTSTVTESSNADGSEVNFGLTSGPDVLFSNLPSSNAENNVISNGIDNSIPSLNVGDNGTPNADANVINTNSLDILASATNSPLNKNIEGSAVTENVIKNDSVLTTSNNIESESTIQGNNKVKITEGPLSSVNESVSNISTSNLESSNSNIGNTDSNVIAEVTTDGDIAVSENNSPVFKNDADLSTVVEVTTESNIGVSENSSPVLNNNVDSSIIVEVTSDSNVAVSENSSPALNNGVDSSIIAEVTTDSSIAVSENSSPVLNNNKDSSTVIEVTTDNKIAVSENNSPVNAVSENVESIDNTITENTLMYDSSTNADIVSEVSTSLIDIVTGAIDVAINTDSNVSVSNLPNSTSSANETAEVVSSNISEPTVTDDTPIVTSIEPEITEYFTSADATTENNLVDGITIPVEPGAAVVEITSQTV